MTNTTTTLKPKELEYFKYIVESARNKLSLSEKELPIYHYDFDKLKGKDKEALGFCCRETIGNVTQYRIYIDEFFIQECYEEFIGHPYLKFSEHSLNYLIAHEIAHIIQWRHCIKHKQITQHLLGIIES